MKRILFLCLVFCAADAYGQYDDWEIYQTNGLKISEATLLSYTSDSLFITSNSEQHSLPVSSITRIERRESGRKTVVGLLFGAVVGIGAGFLAGEVIAAGSSNGSPYSTSGDKSSAKGVSIAAGGVLGAAVGASVGASAGMRKYTLRDKTPEERLALIQSLVGREQSLAARRKLSAVVKLKNGTSAKGEVIAWLPDSTVTIQSSENLQTVYPMTDVERIDIDSTAVPPLNPRNDPPPKAAELPLPATSGQRAHSMIISAGLAVPVSPSDFTGYWKPGFHLGAGVADKLSSVASVILSFEYNNFPLDADAFLRAAGQAGSGAKIDGGTISIITITGCAKASLGGSSSSVSPFLQTGIGYLHIGMSDVSVRTSYGFGNVSTTGESALLLTVGGGAEVPVGETTSLIFQASYGNGLTKGTSTEFLQVKTGLIFRI